MKRFALALALACALSGTTMAGEIPTSGVAAPGDIPSTDVESPGDMHTGDIPIPLVVVQLILDFAF